MISGHGAPARLRAEDRITERAVWRTVELLLESAVFLIMGLEVSTLIAEVHAEHGSVRVAVVLGLVAALVIVVVRSAFIALSLWSLARRERRANAVRELLRIRDLGTYPFVVLEEALSQIDADQVGMELRQTA